MKKRFVIITIFIIIAIIPIFAFAVTKNDWHVDDDGIRRYYNQYGYPANGAEQIYNTDSARNDYYYFVDGIPQTGWIKLDMGYAYYFSDGKGAEGWALIDGRWYYFNWYSGGGVIINLYEQGTPDSDEVGWIEINGQRCFIDPYETVNTNNFSDYGARSLTVNGKTYLQSNDRSLLYGWQVNYQGLPIYCDSSGEIAKGFKKINGNIYYFNKFNGVKTIGEEWINIDGSYDKYTFDDNGILLYKNDKQINAEEFDLDEIEGLARWEQVGDTWYYIQETGVTYKNGWLSIDGVWYYFNADGAMTTGWQNDGGAWYYFNPSGAMVTGWLNDGGAWYYFNPSGAMVTGWLFDGGTWYCFEPSGAMVTGWLQIGGTWYYFDASGAMATGTRIINGTEYTFDASGAWVENTIQTGWLQDDGHWYYYDESGTKVTGWKSIGGIWYYFNDSGTMATGWQKVSGTWYYFNDSGAMATGWKSIGGTWYWFDHNGQMATGWKEIDEQWEMFADSGEWLYTSDGV